VVAALQQADVPPEEFCARIPRHALECRIDVTDHARQVRQDNPISGLLNGRPQRPVHVVHDAVHEMEVRPIVPRTAVYYNVAAPCQWVAEHTRATQMPCFSFVGCHVIFLTRVEPFTTAERFHDRI
jgi:hypothetical protein